ncbi:MAG: hypothetical protein WC901_07350 [Candidatus Margulisiibacteriota bacterium]
MTICETISSIADPIKYFKDKGGRNFRIEDNDLNEKDAYLQLSEADSNQDQTITLVEYAAFSQTAACSSVGFTDQQLAVFRAVDTLFNGANADQLNALSFLLEKDDPAVIVALLEALSKLLFMPEGTEKAKLTEKLVQKLTTFALADRDVAVKLLTQIKALGEMIVRWDDKKHGGTERKTYSRAVKILEDAYPGISAECAVENVFMKAPVLSHLRPIWDWLGETKYGGRPPAALIYRALLPVSGNAEWRDLTMTNIPDSILPEVSAADKEVFRNAAGALFLPRMPQREINLGLELFDAVGAGILFPGFKKEEEFSLGEYFPGQLKNDCAYNSLRCPANYIGSYGMGGSAITQHLAAEETKLKKPFGYYLEMKVPFIPFWHDAEAAEAIGLQISVGTKRTNYVSSGKLYLRNGVDSDSILHTVSSYKVGSYSYASTVRAFNNYYVDFILNFRIRSEDAPYVSYGLLGLRWGCAAVENEVEVKSNYKGMRIALQPTPAGWQPYYALILLPISLGF